MAKRKQKNETDSIYFLKILIYFVLGTVWLVSETKKIFPIGLVFGILFAHHEHFQIDRKIEFPVLILAALLSLFGPGIFFLI